MRILVRKRRGVCELVSTIPLVLASSLVVLFCVLGYIFLMVLIGYCVWKQHMKKALAEQEEKEEEEEKLKSKEQPSDVPRATSSRRKRQPTQVQY